MNVKVLLSKMNMIWNILTSCEERLLPTDVLYNPGNPL